MDANRHTMREVASLDAAFEEEGITLPSGIDLADAQIWVLPTKRWDRILFEEQSVEAVKIAAECGIQARLLSDDPSPRFAIQKSADLILPAIMVHMQGAQQVPWSMLANYLTSLLGLHPRDTRVRSKLYVKDEKGTLRFEYEGSASELVPALEEARKLRDA